MSCTSRILFHPLETVSCKLSGDSDAYGLGIRLGTYIIWACSIIAQQISREETLWMRTLSSCFQLSTLIAIIRAAGAQHYSLYAPQHYSIFAIDAYLLLALCVGGVCTSTYLTGLPASRSLANLKTYIPLDVSGAGGLLRLLILPTSAGLGLWFANSGVELFCKSTCTNVVFVFAKVSIYGWYQTLLKAIFSIYLICVAIIFGWTAYAVFLRYRGRSGAPNAATNEAERSDERPGVVSLLIGMVVMVLFILAIELPIYWNGIVDVRSLDSFAQILPLVIAAIQLCRVLYAVSRESGLGEIRLKSS